MCLINKCECCSLDLVFFAYDAISFARNMLMQYHALYFVLLFFHVPYFLLCFSVSFLLSRFSYLLMAPKKSVLSENQITRRGSSSSPSPHPTDRVWFRDVDSQKDFVENFHDRAIHLEC